MDTIYAFYRDIDKGTTPEAEYSLLFNSMFFSTFQNWVVLLLIKYYEDLKDNNFNEIRILKEKALAASEAKSRV
jgi:hypothetical protein